MKCTAHFQRTYHNLLNWVTARISLGSLQARGRGSNFVGFASHSNPPPQKKNLGRGENLAWTATGEVAVGGSDCQECHRLRLPDWESFQVPTSNAGCYCLWSSISPDALILQLWGLYFSPLWDLSSHRSLTVPESAIVYHLFICHGTCISFSWDVIQ